MPNTKRISNNIAIGTCKSSATSCASPASARSRSTPGTSAGPPGGRRTICGPSACRTWRLSTPRATRRCTASGWSMKLCPRIRSTATWTCSRWTRAFWETPPFEPTVRDGRLYARGAADDKGNLFIPLKAVEALAAVDGRPPVNVKFLLEGEEEIGSPSLPALLKAHAKRLRCDAVLCRGRRVLSGTAARHHRRQPGHLRDADRRAGRQRRLALRQLRRRHSKPIAHAGGHHRRACARPTEKCWWMAFTMASAS